MTQMTKPVPQRANNKAAPRQRLYSLKEAAVYLGRTVWSVRELVWSRELPVIQSGRGGKQYLDINDLDEWIEKNKSVLR